MSTQPNDDCFLCQFKNDDARFLADLAIGLEQLTAEGEQAHLAAMLTAYHDLDLVKKNLSVEIERIRTKLEKEGNDQDRLA